MILIEVVELLQLQPAVAVAAADTLVHIHCIPAAHIVLLDIPIVVVVHTDSSRKNRREEQSVVVWQDRNIQWVGLSVHHTVHRMNRKREEEQLDSLVVEYRMLLLDLHMMHTLQLLQPAADELVDVVVAAAGLVVAAELVVEPVDAAVVVGVAVAAAVAVVGLGDQGKKQGRVGRMDRKVADMIEEEQSVVESHTCST